METDNAILEGAISVTAALQSGSRPIHFIAIRGDKNDPAIRRLEQDAQRRGVLVKRESEEALDAYVTGKTHGGVIASVGERKFAPLQDLIASGEKCGWCVMIDGVEDPFNFAASIRSLYAAGASGLVVRPRNWMSAAGVVARASAGASELIPTAIAETAEEAASAFRAAGYLIACAGDGPGSRPLYENDLTQPLFLLIGGEKRGVTRSFQDRADMQLEIPYARPEAHSLGTAAAAAVFAFEILRQRGYQTASRPSAPRHAQASVPRGGYRRGR
ncbi:23S rRNA (guanosine(2251)-2'-O)-methyltransferase RlmB [Capsulimonas corticalis]|uniref:23S rRNA (Guanosine(2251)-2'-O)-methyltransferase RlmB n=1 Tax=Capsulimonas corticalis TaxID=2219043 RepID=A0A402CXR7_9BACT|nr:TrmH family RNA methyltransferase [Capsulimonas corticalis]BDI32188.1 23S rRNA (guanosine(2251)-2'-O)-methyltransferase RlmB [Capsulimonas corticalis]